MENLINQVKKIAVDKDQILSRAQSLYKLVQNNEEYVERPEIDDKEKSNLCTYKAFNDELIKFLNYLEQALPEKKELYIRLIKKSNQKIEEDPKQLLEVWKNQLSDNFSLFEKFNKENLVKFKKLCEELPIFVQLELHESWPSLTKKNLEAIWSILGSLSMYSSMAKLIPANMIHFVQQKYDTFKTDNVMEAFDKILEEKDFRNDICGLLKKVTVDSTSFDDVMKPDEFVSKEDYLRVMKLIDLDLS